MDPMAATKSWVPSSGSFCRRTTCPPRTFVGGASIPTRFDGAYLTLSNELAVEAAKLLGAATIIPVHFDGWAHFSSSGEDLRSAFAAAGLTERLAFAEPGQAVSVT